MNTTDYATSETILGGSQMRRADLESEVTSQRARLFVQQPYGTNREWKRTVFRDMVVFLVAHHYERCWPYRRILEAMNYVPRREVALEDIPFLPTGLFKRFELASIPQSEISR